VAEVKVCRSEVYVSECVLSATGCLKNLRHIVLNCKKEGREEEKVKEIIYSN
jgi:hypothetical protein